MGRAREMTQQLGTLTTRVQSPASILGISKLSVTPVLRDPTPSSDLHVDPNTHTHTHTHTHRERYTHIP